MNFPRSPPERWVVSAIHSKQTSPRIFVCGVVLVFYLASYSITDKESKIFLIFIGVVGDECMLILSLARHIATTYINTGHQLSIVTTLHQASDIITNTRYIYRYTNVKIDDIELSY